MDLQRTTRRCARIQRATYPQLNRLQQFAAQHNPLGLIPTAAFGNVASADRNANNDGGTGQISYDGRWPIYGNDIAINAAINLTHTRGKPHLQDGLMREDELFGQARSGTFAGAVQLRRRQQPSEPHRLRVLERGARSGARYTESLGRVPDDRRQKTWAWYVQDTWKITPKLTMDYGLRMYKWGPNMQPGRRGVGVQRGALRSDVGRQSARVLPAGAGRQARAARRIRARARSFRRRSSA